MDMYEILEAKILEILEANKLGGRFTVTVEYCNDEYAMAQKKESTEIREFIETVADAWINYQKKRNVCDDWFNHEKKKIVHDGFLNYLKIVDDLWLDYQKIVNDAWQKFVHDTCLDHQGIVHRRIVRDALLLGVRLTVVRKTGTCPCRATGFTFDEVGFTLSHYPELIGAGPAGDQGDMFGYDLARELGVLKTGTCPWCATGFTFDDVGFTLSHIPELIDAGDQGHMFGYETDDVLASKLGVRLTEVRKTGLRPQATVEHCNRQKFYGSKGVQQAQRGLHHAQRLIYR